MNSLHHSLLERKKIYQINLKTNFPETKINPKLYEMKRLNVSELVNQPVVKKKKFSIFGIASSMKKSIFNSTNIMGGKDLNKTEADLTPFTTMEVLSETSFTSTNLESERTDYTISNLNKMKQSKTLNTFTNLVKEDYSGYIKILKRIYPNFKFNHYNRINNDGMEYYEKYGEEGDINNRNYVKKMKNKKEIEYKQSNLLDILGLQENISIEPKKFVIKTDFLNRKDPYELKMIKEDLSFKTGVIDKELNHILESEANVLYNYNENNLDLKNKINDFSTEMKKKIDKQKILKKNYICNSAKILLKGNKKKQLINLMKPLKILNELNICMKKLKFISLSDNENKIKQISDQTNIAKEKIRLLKAYNIKIQKGTIFFDIESKIMNYENQGEMKLNDQLSQNFERLINLTLIYNQNDEIYNVITQGSESNKKSYNLDKETDNKFIYNENDFQLIKNGQNENIYIKYLLIYKNNQLNNKIYKLLISILDMFDIIIKDNMDISSIIDLFKNLFHKIITNNFEEIEKVSTNKLINIEIISNCYSIILSNFLYTIQLIQSNFGLNGKKIFSEVFDKMKNEMDDLIKALILAYLHEKIFDIENNWMLFLLEEDKVKTLTKIYLQNSKINLNEMDINLYQDYITSFNDIKSKELREQYNQLLWEQIIDIDEKYQQMFDILGKNQNINNIQIPLEEIILISEKDTINEKNEKNEKNEFLFIKTEKNDNDTKHKISKFSYSYIKYLYEYLVIYTKTPNQLKDNIINQIMKLTKDILTFSRDLIINNETGMINGKQITEKETALYYSDLIIIEKCLKNFIDAKNFGNIILTSIQETVDTLNSLKNSCYDVILHLNTEVSNIFISEFKKMDFNNYNVFEGKDYNLYIKKLTTLKRLYDATCNSFSEKDINKIFSQTFDNMFNQLRQCVIDKGIIDKDDQLKQFRNELTYIKRVLKLFALVDCEKFKNIIDEISIKANPNKMPKKKKKVKHSKEEENDGNDD